MIKLHKLTASCLGIGYVKGGGTLAAMVCCVGWWLVQQDGSFNRIMILITALILFIGIWSATMVEADWGKDSGRIVIDEAAGMCTSLLFVPVSWKYLFVGLLVFRFFDIVKPLFIRKMESLPGGWGVMMDDVLAGVYTNLLLQVMLYYTIL